MTAVIISYCRIKGNAVTVNGQKMFAGLKDLSASEFPAALYKEAGISYPKFHKMDRLCKLGFLTVELTIGAQEGFKGSASCALIFANRSSSLETDRKHAGSIADKTNYFPSPSVFVYTLANIVAGEIAIRHGITGENAFFISEQFEPKTLEQYAGLLFDNGLADRAVCGWLQADGEEQDIFVYCLKKANFKESIGPLALEHSQENLRNLYHK